MPRVKLEIQGLGITACLSYWQAMKRTKGLDCSTFVDYAYQEDGYIGYDLQTGKTAPNPGPTTIKLYAIDENNERSLQDLRNSFRQDWHRLQRKIHDRVKEFYSNNYQVG